jgi:hypothetical protein
MAKVLPVGLIIAVLILICKPGYAQQKVSLDQANAMVVVPGSMKSFTDTIPTEVGEILYYTYVWNDSVFQFQLSYCEYPEGTLHSDSTELLKDFFSATIAASTEKMKGEQRYASEMVQFGFPGWFWRTDYGPERFNKSKAFVAGRKFYKMQVTGLKKNDLDPVITRYFDSFQFIDLSRVRK